MLIGQDRHPGTGKKLKEAGITRYRLAKIAKVGKRVLFWCHQIKGQDSSSREISDISQYWSNSLGTLVLSVRE
ncbi:16140_t:CDS:2 [Cetraspora pellucida]|uniref:16140_t:CDS:1 n=1 Tax=Cetraspora pellucida TaxID=1433469 RepID=A0A9N9I040_9GLOM|nr:16140_t:CDS:2 [Cetraspora pellucida]